MDRKVIIACALTGASASREINPALPVTPREIAESGIEAARSGAAILHIHVRDPLTAAPSMNLEFYREVVDRIRSSNTDPIINLTTGAGARFVPDASDPRLPSPESTLSSPQARVRHIEELKPEMCSLDLGSMNMGDFVFVNAIPHVRQMAAAIRSANVKPELEVFDASHILVAQDLVRSGRIAGTPVVQMCLGVSGGAPATPETMLYMRSLLPAGCIWFAFGVGRYQFPMVALSLLLGGHVRVGLEDNLYLAYGTLAPSNAALVAKANRIAEVMDVPVASPTEARRILELGN